MTSSRPIALGRTQEELDILHRESIKQQSDFRQYIPGSKEFQQIAMELLESRKKSTR